MIYIHNVPRVEYYSWNVARGTEWIAGPMKLPPDGWRPIPRQTTVIGLQKYPLFVEVRRGRKYNLRADSGLTAYRYINANGTLSLQIPEMNFFDVLKQNVEGRREAYSNIEIADQPEQLFRPPDGATVVATTRAGGIVSQPADSVEDHSQHSIRGRPAQ